MATIKEIADLAGVSRGTVDRVLNNRGSVNPVTAEKIREIANTLHYKPNKAGIALAAQKKKLKIGVVLFGEGNPFFDEVVRGVHKRAEELSGYNCTVLLKQVSDNVQAQLDAIDSLLKKDIHGLAISPYNAPEIADCINRLYDKGIPVVTLNTDIENSKRIAYVGSNYYLSGQTAGGLMGLVTGGTAKVGIISGSPKILCHTERIAGFKDCITKQYPGIEIIDTIHNQDDEHISYRVTKALLADHPEINALYFAAAGVFGGCKALLADSSRKEKPCRIITYDNVPSTRELVKQGIISATICQQPLLQGTKPLDILFSYLTSGELPKREYNYVAADIRIRENI
ncbi:MAG: substrate-binding domain-containing protein [Clostridiales bacterium]|nr:substrate-binding domain-containing protein [Clostridiales bacterium]